jgi:hypothetical protein
VVFSIWRPVATARRHRTESVMCINARKGGIRMCDNMDDIRGRRDNATAELEVWDGVMAEL